MTRRQADRNTGRQRDGGQRDGGQTESAAGETEAKTAIETGKTFRTKTDCRSLFNKTRIHEHIIPCKLLFSR